MFWQDKGDTDSPYGKLDVDPMNSAAPGLKAANTDGQMLDSYTTEATVAELFTVYTTTLLYVHFT